MCYLEIAETASVNKKLSRLTNPTVSLYFAELLEILKQVRAKNKFDPLTGEFKLDRKYVYDETGIDTEEQKNADLTLFKLGIIKVNPSNADRLAVDVKRYFEVLSDDSLVPEELLPKSVKLTAAEKKAATKAAIQAGIVKLFGYEDDESNAVIARLVEVYYSKGYCKHAQWTPIVSLIKACTSDSKGLEELVDYIISTNWQNIRSAIDSFMQKHRPTGTKLNTDQQTCQGTLFGVEF